MQDCSNFYTHAAQRGTSLTRYIFLNRRSEVVARSKRETAVQWLMTVTEGNFNGGESL